MRFTKLLIQVCIFLLILFSVFSCQKDEDSSETVTPVTLSSISVTPANYSLAKGALVQLTATGTYSNNTTEDLTSSVTWSSSDSSIVTVNDTTSDATGDSVNSKGQVTALKSGSVTIAATLGTISGNTTLTVSSATLQSIQVTPSYPTYALNYTPSIQFNATGIYSDGTIIDLTEYVVWSSSQTDKTTINNATGKRGLAFALAAGTTTVKAVFSDTSADVSGDTVLTLTSETIDSTLNTLQFTPVNPTIAIGTKQQFKATVILTDGTNKRTQDITKGAIWTSSDLSVAPVENAENSHGTADATSDGAASISATYGSVSGDSTTLTVTTATLNSLQVTLTSPSLSPGIDHQLKATGIYLLSSTTTYSTQDLTDGVVWSSSDTALAIVCNAPDCKGRVKTLAAGTVILSANAPNSSVSGTTTLTINATDEILTEIQITPTNPAVYSGTIQNFKATGIYTDGTNIFHQDITNAVLWSSSDESVALVSNEQSTKGRATNRSAGETTIKASLGSTSVTSKLTILASTMALSSIGVFPGNPSIALGMAKSFMAQGVFSDGTSTIKGDITDQVIWTSGNTAVVRVSNAGGSHGLATSISQGSTTITASLGSKSGSSTLSVLDDTNYIFYALEISPAASSVSIAPGSVEPFQATGIFYNSSTTTYRKLDLTDSVTWMSSDSAIVTVSNLSGSKGIVLARAAGSATITASWTYKSTAKSSYKSLIVNSMSLQSIQITPSNTSLVLNQKQTYTSRGIFSDGSSLLAKSIDHILTWRSSAISSDSILAPISNADDSRGVSVSLRTGASKISAQNGTISAEETLTVVDETLQSITLYPSESTIVRGISQKFIAFGKYSDNVFRDITDSVRWQSSDTSKVIIINDPKANGLATSLAAGTTVITASQGGVNQTTSLTVLSDSYIISALQITPSTPKMGLNTRLQLTATGIFSASGSNTSQNLTDFVYWISSDSTVATISNDEASSGQVYANGAGSVTITGYWTTPIDNTQKTGTITLTVLSSSVAALQISPVKPSGPVGYSQVLQAIALYGDNYSQDVTESVVWTSSDKSIATVSNIPGNKGLVTRISYGSATITATLATQSTTAQITVW